MVFTIWRNCDSSENAPHTFSRAVALSSFAYRAGWNLRRRGASSSSTMFYVGRSHRHGPRLVAGGAAGASYFPDGVLGIPFVSGRTASITSAYGVAGTILPLVDGASGRYHRCLQLCQQQCVAPCAPPVVGPEHLLDGRYGIRHDGVGTARTVFATEPAHLEFQPDLCEHQPAHQWLQQFPLGEKDRASQIRAGQAGVRGIDGGHHRDSGWLFLRPSAGTAAAGDRPRQPREHGADVRHRPGTIPLR